MKQIYFLFALLLITIYVNAAPADPTPFKVLQPSGDSITIRLLGSSSQVVFIQKQLSTIIN